MPQNSPGRAGSIKECLKSYGFQDVWTQLQSIDSKAIKLAIGVPVHTNTSKSYTEAGMISLSEQRKLAISKYVIRSLAVITSVTEEIFID